MAAAATSPSSAATADPVLPLFQQLAQIPRPSKREQQVVAWLREFAAERSLKFRQDAYGNCVIYKRGQGGGEAAPTVIIQGHVDMVCEKNAASPHDFNADPIRLVAEAGWLKADGTTLGADNGVGVAAALAVLDLPPDVPCPPVEALFTVEEEIGLLGAAALDGGMLSGKTLLNLDSEDWGVIYIGCAGAGESNITLTVDVESVDAAGLVPQTLSLTGLVGGHSGLRIHEGLGNAVQLTAGALAAVVAAAPGTRLVEIRGGDKRNAIPRDTSADLLVPAGQLEAARAAVAAQGAALRQVYGGLEPSLDLSLGGGAAAAAAAGGEAAVVSRAGADALVALLTALPHGPVRMSPKMAGLVETSTNLASIKPAPRAPGSPRQAYAVVSSTRSSIPAALAAERARVAAVARLAGAKVEQPPDYAGWAPNPDSPLLALTKEAVAKACGREPEVTAIHAGLECGVLGSVLGGDVDMISYGPTILGAHSPDERLELATVEPFWRATLSLLGELAKRR